MGAWVRPEIETCMHLRSDNARDVISPGWMTMIVLEEDLHDIPGLKKKKVGTFRVQTQAVH